MFAIIEIGGKQFKVEQGTKLLVEKIEEKEGSEITFGKVLFINGKIGIPFVEGAYALAKILEHGKGEKLITIKQIAKKRYKRKLGHRQPFTKIEIIEIKESGTKATPKAKDEVKEEVKTEKKPKAVKKTAKKQNL